MKVIKHKILNTISNEFDLILTRKTERVKLCAVMEDINKIGIGLFKQEAFNDIGK